MDHVLLPTLEAGLDHIRASPADDGRIALIVRRPAPAEREELEHGTLDPVDGLLGDSWRARGSRHTTDGSADPAMQLTLMNARVAALVAGRPERRALAGDQLYVDLDLSYANIPPARASGSAPRWSRSPKRRTAAAGSSSSGSAPMRSASSTRRGTGAESQRSQREGACPRLGLRWRQDCDHGQPPPRAASAY